MSYRPENCVRDGFRMCTTCTAEKPDTPEFFEPSWVGKCRLCVFLDAPECTWGRATLAYPPSSILTHRKKIYGKGRKHLVTYARREWLIDRKLRQIFCTPDPAFSGGNPMDDWRK